MYGTLAKLSASTYLVRQSSTEYYIQLGYVLSELATLAMLHGHVIVKGECGKSNIAPNAFRLGLMRSALEFVNSNALVDDQYAGIKAIQSYIEQSVKSDLDGFFPVKDHYVLSNFQKRMGVKIDD
jgi:hypothetical protein